MTCANIVHVAISKLPGVETVDVSLNKALATVKLKPGNKTLVAQLWQVLHKKGYTPNAASVLVRGELASVQGRLQLKVSGTADMVALTGVSSAITARLGKTVSLQGVMMPAKDLKADVPLKVSEVK